MLGGSSAPKAASPPSAAAAGASPTSQSSAASAAAGILPAPRNAGNVPLVSDVSAAESNQTNDAASLPTLSRAGSVAMLRELAEECVCPISQFLMVDPVIAEDGHTYDRLQIETWIRQQRDAGQDPPTSPQTREPLTSTRLVSNLALRRTIERLVDSGRLDAQTVNDWRTAKEAEVQRAIHAKRSQSLARAPIGTKLKMPVTLVLNSSQSVIDDIVSGKLSLGQIHAELWLGSHVSNRSGQRFPTIRQLLTERDLAQVWACLIAPEAGGQGDSYAKVKALLQAAEAGALPPAPLPADTLLRSVFVDLQSSHGDVFELEYSSLAVEHIVKRLAVADQNGMPAPVRAEWEILDAELQLRRRKSRLARLRETIGQAVFGIEAVVRDVDSSGNFILEFPSLEIESSSSETGRVNEGDGRFVAQVSSEFIGVGGVIGRFGLSNRAFTANSGGGLFGGVNAGGRLFGGNSGGALFGGNASGGLFGRNTGGGLFGEVVAGNAGGVLFDSLPPPPPLFGGNTGGGLFGGNTGGVLLGGNNGGGLFAGALASNSGEGEDEEHAEE